MRKICRGIILATGLMSLPLFAQADCPPVDSIDRYAQTAGDALSALHELVPESQQRALEDRYAAMILLKWQWQGRDAIRADANAMAQLLACYEQAECGIRSSDQITTQIVAKLNDTETDPLLLESLLPRAPSDRSFTWAKRTLGCDAPATAPVQTTQVIEAPITEASTQLPGATNVVVTNVEASPILNSTRVPAEQAVRDGIVQPAAELRQRIVNFEPAAPTGTESTDLVTASTTLETPQTPVEQVVPVTTESVDALMLKATEFITKGKPTQAIVPLETACLIEAKRIDKSSACETLFGVYTNTLVARTAANSTNSYLDLSSQLCEIGYSRGCDNLSRFYAAQNSAEAHRAAVTYAEQSCNLDNAEACATVSGFYLAGRASEPDPAAAREKLEQSCRLGRLLSCQEVADFYSRGIGGPVDPAMALQMIEASCPETRAERADLCVSAADYILIHETAGFERGERVRTFIKRACDIGHDVGCAWYAEDLELGIGGNVDLPAARRARLTACEYGDQESCNSRS